MPALRSQNQIFDELERYPLIERVFELSAARGLSVYLVGGTVRDLLIGQDTHDLDFAVQGSGLALARHIADRLGGYFVPLDRERRTGRVLLPHPVPSGPSADLPQSVAWPQHLDIASLRGDSLQADLEGRDFTFNAIAIARINANWHIVDPLGGIADLSSSVLRMASPSSFDDDPVRTLRAVRMQIQFGCTIDSGTCGRLRSAAPLLERISAERVRDEWFKILQLANTATALEEMVHLGLLNQLAPSSIRGGDLEHALQTVRATERLWIALCAPGDQPRASPEQLLAERLDALVQHLCHRYKARICDERSYLALLKLAALLHETQVAGAALAARWKLSRREAELLHTAIHHHRKVQALANCAGLTRRQVYRFFAEAGDPGIDALLIFLAHKLATEGTDLNPESWKHQTEEVVRLLHAWFEHRTTQIEPTPLLSGKDVMRALDRPPGPQIGKLLRGLAEEQAAGEILTREQALAFVRRWKTRNEGKTANGEQG